MNERLKGIGCLFGGEGYEGDLGKKKRRSLILDTSRELSHHWKGGCFDSNGSWFNEGCSKCSGK